jgi:nucleoside triphosphatase
VPEFIKANNPVSLLPTELYPEPVVAAIIRNKGKILLTQSYKWHDKYSIPGGHVLDGEKIIDALKREVKEETGIEIKSFELVGVGELIRSPEYYDDLKHFILFVFSIEPLDPKIALDVEAHNFTWADIKEVASWDNVTTWTKAALKAKRTKGSVIEFTEKR